jgi:hypothetical protein
VRDLDLEAGTLRVSGKTGAREIHLAPATLMLLCRAASGKRPDAVLLPPADRPYWTRNLHDKRFARAVAKAEVDRATCFYSLRHSFISHALKCLVPVKAIADHCGTSLAMVERSYGKFIIADKARYAAISCPELRVDDTGAKVVQLRRPTRLPGRRSTLYPSTRRSLKPLKAMSTSHGRAARAVSRSAGHTGGPTGPG